jgi:zinc transport system substrate-binding protein
MTRPFLATVALALAAAPGLSAPMVATDIPPVHSIVARVMQGVGTPQVIVPPGA